MQTVYQEKLNSIFEININERKLVQIIQSITKTISHFAQKFADLQSKIDSTQKNHNEQTINLLENVDSKIIMLRQSLDRKMQDSSVAVAIKLSELSNAINYRAKDVQSVVNNTKEMMKGQLNEMQQRFTDLMEEKEETARRNWNSLNEQVQKIYCLMEKTDANNQKLNYLYFEGVQKLKQVEQEVKQLKQKSQQEKWTKINTPNQINKTVSAKRQIRNTVCNNGNEKDSMISKINKLKTIEYASISKKIDHLEERINETQNKPVNLIAYPSKNNILSRTINFTTIDHKEETFYEPPPQVQMREKRYSMRSKSNSIVKRNSFQRAQGNNLVDQLDKKLIIWMKQIKDEMNELKFKIQTVQEGYGGLIRKQTRINNLQKEFKLKLEEIMKLKTDEEVIIEIKRNFKSISTKLYEEQARYISIQKYNKDCDGYHSKLLNLEQNLLTKTDKQDVKNAFSFIQSKIKEIVVILSSNFSKEKVGALNKTQQIKCLTCDREADIENDQKSSTMKLLNRSTINKNCKVIRQLSRNFNMNCAKKGYIISKTEHE